MAIEMSTQTQKIFCVINIKNDDEIEKIKKNLNDFAVSGYKYYCILHDKDVDEIGVLKTKHFHLLLSGKVFTRASTWLKRISNILEIAPEQVSMKHVDSFVSCVKYLIHKKQSNKYQYDRCDILTSEPMENLNALLDSEEEQPLSVVYLGQLFEELDGNKFVMIDIIGFTRYSQNYRAVNEIWDYLSVHKKSIRDDNLLESTKLNKDIKGGLPF